VAQLDDTFSDKTLDTLPDLPGGGSGRFMTSKADLLLLGKADQLHTEILGHGDLEKVHFEGETLLDGLAVREGRFDLRIERILLV